MANSVIHPVILCGGSGTRLWPLSRAGFPKQFLVLSGNGNQKSLFQEAVERIHMMQNPSHVIGKAVIVTNDEHRFLVLDQLRELKGAQADLILEPLAKNTAPALTLAALAVKDESLAIDPILVMTPADQTIQDDAAFISAIQKSVAILESDQNQNAIVVLGVPPSSPETGYGYIKRSTQKGDFDQFDVERFVEKPDATAAQAYLKDGNYFWNSGLFILRASTWLSALEQFRPDILASTKAAWQSRTTDDANQTLFIRPDADLFNQIPGESIDYAVIEKCPGSQFPVKMVALDAGWNDLGAWNAVWQVGKKDGNGNVTAGDAILSNTKNSLIYSSDRLVSTVGIENLIVIETADAVMVADRQFSQNVKHIVSALEAEKREEKNLHRKVLRPWGWFDSIDQGERFKVKRINVKPGASLSLQMHHHRAEHWIVVKGVAEITNGNQVITLQKNQSTYIPQGQVHRLANPGKEPLEIIEVQSGEYLGEDDIVRYEDTYGRN